MLPSNDCIAACTSCCTSSRITVNKLLCLGINSSLIAPDSTNVTARERHYPLLGIFRRIMLGFSRVDATFRQIGTRGVGTRGCGECAVCSVWRAACASRGRGRMHSCAAIRCR